MPHNDEKWNKYEDGECFKPGEVWESPRGYLYRVERSRVGGQAVLRQGRSGSGRRVYRDWDSVLNGWMLDTPAGTGSS